MCFVTSDLNGVSDYRAAEKYMYMIKLDDITQL